MVGTKVALRLSSAGEALGTQLRAEPCLDMCFSLLYSVFFPWQSFSLTILVPYPTPVYSSWDALWTPSQMLRSSRTSWSHSTPTEENPQPWGTTYQGVSLYHGWRLRRSRYRGGTRGPDFIYHHPDFFRHFGGITTDFLPPRQLGF